jgi:restriction endonuclease S subunit
MNWPDNKTRETIKMKKQEVMKKKFGYGPFAVEITKEEKNLYAVVEVGDCVKHFAGRYKAKSFEDAHLKYIRNPFG